MKKVPVLLFFLFTLTNVVHGIGRSFYCSFTGKLMQPQDSLTKEKIDFLDGKTKLFITDLLTGEFKAARKFVSDTSTWRKIDQLAILKEKIRDANWELVRVIDVFTPDGDKNINLLYARHGDTNKPPLTTLSFEFGASDKIVKIQLLKRAPVEQ